jgi:hypothetical protein
MKPGLLGIIGPSLALLLVACGDGNNSGGGGNNPVPEVSLA